MSDSDKHDIHNSITGQTNETPRISADQATLVPDVGTGPDAASRESSGQDRSEKIQTGLRPGSKEIVLQRLSQNGSWDEFEPARERLFAPQQPSERRPLSTATVVAIAAVIGITSGGIASITTRYVLTQDDSKLAVIEQKRSIDAAIAKMNADIDALKSSGSAQSAKIVDRIDRVEKAQTEPVAKLAKITEALDKLRAPEITGSVAAVPAPITQPKRLPIVEGWVLRDVSDGGATVEGRLGLFEVFAGDPLPGVGRIDAIRRQDGRWVVVTSSGLIVAR